MVTRQYAHFRRQSVARLQAIASENGTRLTVRDEGMRWRIYADNDADPLFETSRFQVADAWLRGYIAARHRMAHQREWTRLARVP